jgi:hypothetical protein
MREAAGLRRTYIKKKRPKSTDMGRCAQEDEELSVMCLDFCESSDFAMDGKSPAWLLSVR